MMKATRVLTSSKRPGTTARFFSKLAAPLLRNKATTTADQDADTENIVSPATVCIMLLASQKNSSSHSVSTALNGTDIDNINGH